MLAFLDYLTPAGGIPRHHHHQAIRGVIIVNDIIARNRQLSNATFTIVNLHVTLTLCLRVMGSFSAPKKVYYGDIESFHV